MSTDSYQQPMSLPPVASQIDQEFTQINQQFQDLSLQYQNPTYEYSTMHHNEAAPPQTETNTMNSYSGMDNEYGQQTHYDQQQQQQQQPQNEYYGQTHQNDSSGSSNNYGDQSAPPPPQMYQSQTFNDPMSYGGMNYGEVTF